jgi:hypothetical protein
MKAKGLIMMGILAHSGVIQVPPVPRFGESVEQLTIDSDLRVTGENSAEGSFETNGLFNDNGSASDEFVISKKSIQEVKKFVGKMGTISVKFLARLSWTGQEIGEAVGRYEIISCTGAYKNMSNFGQSYVRLDFRTGHILTTFTSTVNSY